MTHREERQLTVTLHLSAEFADDYEGDDDGFAWHARFEQQVKPALLRSLFDVLRAQPGYDVVSAPRGRPADEAVDLAVTVRPRDA